MPSYLPNLFAQLPTSVYHQHCTDGERSYTEVKCLGDGSFGTVWLCDWHSPVKKEVLLSAMQCGAGTRREWAGKRLVALKKMKRVWDGGWSEAKNLGELAVSPLTL
jgi:meiosis induction protein kinase IME2/SME1